MSPFDLGSADAPPMTAEKPTASPLSASQIDSLIETVTRTLARGQSVVVMSEGRILARYLPTGIGTGETGGERGEPSYKSGHDK